ncbi:hypothetical protein HDV03_002189 [Kappamyces sp. JEL0829]|nr:hypothetical protein HDV03_002189 [Kappamyces sp. JEL0829]KAJ3350130.1 hypothetical protein HDU91_006292 [Kappamyces sp. JEL0680]
MKAILKRPPPKPATLETDIYVKSSSHMRALLKRATLLLDKREFPAITIHGLGRAIPKAVQLALAIQKERGGPEHVALEVSTKTSQLIDDHIPDGIDEETTAEIRLNSSIHISVVTVKRS